MKEIEKKVKCTCFTTDDADRSRRKTEGKYTANGPTEGLKNDPF